MFNSGNNNFYWAFAELTSDEAVTGGDGSRAGLTELDFFTYTSRTSELNDFWKLQYKGCLLYTSDAADEQSSVDLGGRRIIKKKINSEHRGRVIY